MTKGVHNVLGDVPGKDPLQECDNTCQRSGEPGVLSSPKRTAFATGAINDDLPMLCDGGVLKDHFDGPAAGRCWRVPAGEASGDLPLPLQSTNS